MKKRISIWKIAFLVFLMIGTIYIIRNKQEEQTAKNWNDIDEKGQAYSSVSIEKDYVQNRGSVFGTYYSITYSSAQDLHNEVRETLAKVDNSLSPFNSNSLISAINENRDTVADVMFTHIFNLAQSISEKTGGAFDITVAPLVNAWGFGFRNGIKVDSTTVDSLCRFVGYRNVALENGKIIKQHTETMLDCSAIAKGYGCDAVAESLRKRGINDFLIEIGGEVVAAGRNPKGKAWTIGISKPADDPEGKSNELQTAVKASGKGIATSGNYRNFRQENGRKIAHTIDPRTGYPVSHSLLSATVIADDCATADAYATAFMVMGIEKAMEICSSDDSIDAFFIYSDNDGTLKTAETAGMKNYY